MFLCSVVLYSVGLHFHHQSHHNWALFSLWFCFFILSGDISSHFHSIYWTPSDLGGSTFSVIYFCLLILFMGFSRQECWSGLPFPSPAEHALSELPTMAHLSCMALHSMAHSFIELEMWPMWSAWLVFWDCGFHSVCPLMDTFISKVKLVLCLFLVSHFL